MQCKRWLLNVIRILVAVLICTWVKVTALGQMPCRYTVEYLPNPSPCPFWDRFIEPTGISPNGRYVCGWTSDCGTNSLAVVVDTQTMQMTIIPRPASVISMRAYDVNDNCEAVGTLTKFFGTGGEHAFLWSKGVLTDLGVPSSATDSFGYAINNKAEITGECYVAGFRRAYLWRESNFTLLNLPGSGVGLDIDEKSHIVGYMGGSPFTSHAFLWSDSKVIDLGIIPDGDSAAAYSISPDGDIAGFGADNDFPSGQRARAFLYTNGQMLNLGLLPGAIESRATATNGSVVVGTCSMQNDSAGFMFANGSMRRLDSIQSNASLIIYHTSAISDDGSVAATGRIASVHHGIVLRPIAAPVGDINADCRAGVPDLLAIINTWGACGQNPFCPADLNGDGTVNPLDLIVLIQHWDQQP